MADKNLEFWCVGCQRCYSTKQKFVQHFEHKNVQGDSHSNNRGKCYPNQCSQSLLRDYANSKNAAQMLKVQSEKGSLSKFFPPREYAGRKKISIQEM